MSPVLKSCINSERAQTDSPQASAAASRGFLEGTQMQLSRSEWCATKFCRLSPEQARRRKLWTSAATLTSATLESLGRKAPRQCLEFKPPGHTEDREMESSSRLDSFGHFRSTKTILARYGIRIISTALLKHAQAIFLDASRSACQSVAPSPSSMWCS